MVRVIAAILVITLVLAPMGVWAGQDAVSVLLLGTDNVGDLVTGEEEISRADAIYVVTLQPDTGAVRVLSIERDYLVELPGDLGPNKIGTATYFGGAQMGLDAVNGLLGLDIGHYAQISLPNLVRAIDVVGGIEVEIFEGEVDATNEFIANIPPFNLPPIVQGINHLTGDQAWAFMGNRTMEGDALDSNQDRLSRQMRVISAGLEKLQRLGASDAMALMGDVVSLINTNLSMSNLLSILTLSLKSDLANLDYLTSPQSPHQLRMVNMHRVIVVDDMTAEKELVHRFLYE